jgi:hypothetical protein
MTDMSDVGRIAAAAVGSRISKQALATTHAMDRHIRIIRGPGAAVAELDIGGGVRVGCGRPGARMASAGGRSERTTRRS